MAKYKAYPEYKDSGVESLDTIPKMWSIKKLKYIFEIKKRIAGKIGFDVLSVTQKGIKIKDIESGEGQLSMDYSKYQRVYPGEFAMNHMDLLTGYVDISNYDGVTSPDYRVFAVRDKHSFYSRYYLYLLQDGYKQRRFFHLGQGSAHLGRWRLPTEAFNEIVYPCPSLTEQIHIASFLDHETAKIDNLIEKQQQLIELLKEKRQAVISHAVTKGLNPNVPMKNSGVEWLGEVPEHWKIKRCKNLFNFVTSGSRGWAGFYSDEGDLFFRIANLTRDSINPKLDSIQYVTPPKGSEGERSKIKENDLLISITADLGSVCAADGSISGGYVSQHVSLCRPGRLVASSRWLAYFVLSDTAKEQLQGAGYGGTKVQLSLEDIRDLFVAYPPKSEQIKIASYLDERLSDLDGLDHRAHNLIELLRERRTALISAAVTGKIDVRDWVAPDTQNVEEPQEATA
ncbi:restriction endonuclease subunit S [Klebsiella aerogenes]|nr:restriction endonuclease subunit S [Klebsiella aerogenes]